MADTILDEIKAAQRAPTDDYMVWAEIGAVQIVLHSVRLPQAIEAETVLSRVRGQAEQTLTEHGFTANEVASALLHISALPSAEETKAELEAQRRPNVAFVAVDLAMWEACRHRLHLSPYTVGTSDQEMDYKGLKIRRSAAG